MERKIYPSDISRKQFEVIRAMLEGARHHIAPRQVDLYDIFCAILYLLKNGCDWRTIPGDFPGWTTVRYYFDHWIELGLSLSTWIRHVQVIIVMPVAANERNGLMNENMSLYENFLSVMTILMNMPKLGRPVSNTTRE